MGSKDQITQIIGRVLRQPQAQHYPDPSLNTAHFYIRTDEKKVFEEVLQEVRNKIAAETPEITLTVFVGKKGASSKLELSPKKRMELPEVSIDSSNAIQPIKKILKLVQDYRKDDVNTVGKGGRIQVLQTIGKNGKDHEEWVEVEHSNKVTARWIFSREVQKTYAKALNLCDIEDSKFDALIEYNSLAAEHIREAANKVVSAYIDHSVIIQNFANPVEVPGVSVDPSNVANFKNALHGGYSDLNTLEMEFADALDKSKKLWFRNASRGLFEVPLLARGESKNFNPDFIVWADKEVIAIDTKGDHLIVEDSGRKLFHVHKIGKGTSLVIKLVTRGKWDEKVQKVNNDGFTVWVLKNGKPHPHYTANVNDAVQICMRPT